MHQRVISPVEVNPHMSHKSSRFIWTLHAFTHHFLKNDVTHITWTRNPFILLGTCWLNSQGRTRLILWSTRISPLVRALLGSSTYSSSLRRFVVSPPPSCEALSPGEEKLVKSCDQLTFTSSESFFENINILIFLEKILLCPHLPLLPPERVWGRSVIWATEKTNSKNLDFSNKTWAGKS